MIIRKWTSQEKLPIVLEGLNVRIEITRLCAKYRIAQMQYYQWRDHLLKLGHQAFESKNITKKEQHLEQKVQKLTKIIGDLTVELEKQNTSHEKNKITISYRT